LCCRHRTSEQNSLSLCFFDGRQDNTNQGGSTNIAFGASINDRVSTNNTVTKDSTNQPGMTTAPSEDSINQGGLTAAPEGSGGTYLVLSDTRRVIRVLPPTHI